MQSKHWPKNCIQFLFIRLIRNNVSEYVVNGIRCRCLSTEFKLRDTFRARYWSPVPRVVFCAFIITGIAMDSKGFNGIALNSIDSSVVVIANNKIHWRLANWSENQEPKRDWKSPSGAHEADERSNEHATFANMNRSKRLLSSGFKSNHSLKLVAHQIGVSITLKAMILEPRKWSQS